MSKGAFGPPCRFRRCSGSGKALQCAGFHRVRPIGGCEGRAFIRQRAVSTPTNIGSVCPTAVQAVLLLLSSIKLIAEIALMALLGQGLLYVLAGAKRDGNVFYQLLKVLTRPFTAVARLITPARVADQHVPFVAFFLLVVVWMVVFFEKVKYCVSVDMVGCQ